MELGLIVLVGWIKWSVFYVIFEELFAAFVEIFLSVEDAYLIILCCSVLSIFMPPGDCMRVVEVRRGEGVLFV